MKLNYLPILLLGLTAVVASCSDDDDAVDASGAAGWEIAGNRVVDIKPDRTTNLKNPLTGWVLYTGLGDGLNDKFWEIYDNYPSQDGTVRVSDYATVLFIRAAWTYFNPEEGVYVWNQDPGESVYARRFHYLVDGAKERGLKLAFSFIVDSQDKHDNFTPQYVRDAGCQGFITTTGSVQVWSPYCDDPIFQQKFEEFLDAFAAKYNDPDVTMFMSGFGLGKWGESHSVTYSTGPNNETPREAVVDWASTAYTSRFTKVPCVINYHRCLMSYKSFGDANTAEAEKLINLCVDKGYSLRHDAFGMKSYYTTWERNFALSKRFERPIIAEGGWVESSHGGSIHGDGYADYIEVRQGEFDEAKGASANMLDFRYSSNQYSGETWRWFNNHMDLVKEFIAEGGYRLYPDKVSVPETVAAGHSVAITHRWSNLGWGYCPTNIPQWDQKYKVGFALLDAATLEPVKVWVDTATRLDLWIKGTPTTYTTHFDVDGVASGTYVWGVGLVDVTKYNAIGLRIAARSENVTPQGWVNLGSVTVR